MTNQYIRPGSANIPIAVNDVVLITTPEGTLINTGLGGGTDGAQGTQGVRGAQGTQGVQGTVGVGTQGIQGTAGVGTQGTTGAQGPQGAPGIGGSDITTTDDLTEGLTNQYFTVTRVAYEHTQGSVSDSWTIPHNLGFKPNVTVVDSGGTIYEGEITYTNSNSLTVSFSAAFSGKAYLS
jgi:hypothetical protein